jgi:uncharacterized iron-regulated membrane protein
MGVQITLDTPDSVVDGGPLTPAPTARRTSPVRRIFMRPRRVLVKVHRWTSIVLLAWIVVISITGAYLVAHDSLEAWFHQDRFEHSGDGDVGPDAAVAAATEALDEGAHVYGLTLPGNGRGDYQVYGEIEPAEGSTDPEVFLTVFVDPASGEVNDIRNEAEGFSWWMYRGHMYLWQDYGVFGVFDPDDGWCRRNADGAEPGGAKGVICDVIPDGMDMVGWMAVAFIGILLTGFYLWYWPGVRRWATALSIRRNRGSFTFNLSLHKVIGFVVWIPLLAVSITGAAFAFPNIEHWYDNATPAERDFYLWTPAEEIVSGDAAGREPLTYDQALEIFEERYPDRTMHFLEAPFDETATFNSWVSRGFDPWTREGGAGNTWVMLDQYSGETLYDGSPEDGNVFDQAWDDWSFPIHTGDFGGSISRAVWVVLGLSPIVLGVTGLTMYFIRRKKRANRRAKREVTPPAATVEATSPPEPVGSEV